MTGQVDATTRELMRKPRCGLPDIISDSYRSRSVDPSNFKFLPLKIIDIKEMRNFKRRLWEYSKKF